MSATVITRARRRGFSLIEVLVALCIVALGLGGAATLHLHSQRAAAEAARLSEGVRLAAALAGRMRANRAAMAQGDAANPYLRFDYDVADGAPEAAGHCYDGAGCAPDALARFDLHETARAVAAGFPGGRIVACRDASAVDGASGLGWACDGHAGAPVVIKLGWSGGDGPAMPAVVLPVGAP